MLNNLFSPKDKDEALVLELFRVFRHMRKQTAAPYEDHEMSIGQLQSLISVHLGKATMKDIAEELCVAFPTATIMIDRLVVGGYLDREHDTIDRRIVRLRLTPKGEELLQKSLVHKIERVKHTLLRLTTQDKEDLSRIMQHLLEKLETEDSHGK